MLENQNMLLKLYLNTVQRILEPNYWMEFLQTAAYNYKRDFDEQVLIYAQNPHSKLVLGKNVWISKYKRNIVQDESGISLFSAGEKQNGLKTVYDISDTVETSDSISVPIFKLEHTPEVVRALNEAYGINENELLSSVLSAAEIAAADKMTELLPELASVLSNFEASKRSGEELAQKAIRLVADSSAYMCALRCDIQNDSAFWQSRFQDITAFNSSAVISIGTAVSRSASEVLQTIIMANMKFLAEESIIQDSAGGVTFANPNEKGYNKGTNLKERQADFNGDKLLDEKAIGVYPRAQTDSLHGVEGHRKITGASSDDRAAGERNVGSPDRAESSVIRADGGTQAAQSDAVDRSDDQSARDDAGASASGSDLRVKKNQPRKATGLKNTLPLFLSQEQVDTLLQDWAVYANGKYRIFEQFQKKETPKENANFLKELYSGSGRGAPDGLSILCNNKGLEITSIDGQGTYLMPWTATAKRIEQLIEANRYLLPAEVEAYPAYRQEQAERQVRDAIAQDYSDLVHAYNEVAAEKLNQYVLIVGCMHEFQVGTSDVTHMWHMAGDPIYPLIYESLDTIEKYPEFSARATALKEAFQPYRTDLAEQPQSAQTEFRYEYSVGSQVYIGANKYGILAVDPEVILSDVTFPLLQTQYSKADFEEKLRENPLNESLKVITEVNPSSLPLPTVTCEWSESPVFEDGKTYSIAEYDRLMKQADAEWIRERQKEIDTYGNDIDEIYEAYNRGEISAVHQGYAKTKFTINMSGGRTITERQDIGDGFGGLIDFLQETPYRSIVPELAEAIGLTKESSSEPNGERVVRTVLSPHSKESTSAEPDDALLAEAKRLINLYFMEEFELEEGADFSYLSDVELAYTTTEDETHEIQARANLLDFRIETLVDNTVVRSEEYSNLEDMIDRGLHGLDFNELVYLSDDELAQFQQTAEVESAAEPVAVSAQQDVPKINYQITDFDLSVGTAKERFRSNISAVQTLHALERENRNATSAEQEILAKYVGWGGLADAFDATKENWSAEFQELQEVLSSAEYESARASTLTAFYTPPAVIQAIYTAIGNMGFKAGNILDPACGTGNFFGMLPKKMQKSKLYGVEIDSLSGRIAQKLYPNAAIGVQGFEDALLPNSFFDVAVGNVPFGSMKVFDAQYNRLNFVIHDYFFAKTIDKVRPGGVIAFLTSNGIGGGTMDKRDNRVRKYIAQRCEFLGAIRLPNDTFRKSAGTDISTDILFLQKRERAVDIELNPPEWIDAVTVHESEYTDNDGNKRRQLLTTNPYYQNHPEMVLGEEKIVSGPYGPQLACKPFENADLSALLERAIQNIHAVIEEQNAELTETADTANVVPADPNVRNFSYTVLDGELYYRENAQMFLQDFPNAKTERIKGLIGVRDCVRKLLDYQTEDYPDTEIKRVQADLNRLYDDFTKKFGYLTSRTNRSAFQEDSSSALMFALERLDDDGNVIGKADIFSKRTIRAQKPITHADTAVEALTVSVSERAKVDMAFMQELTGKDEQMLAEELRGIVFLNPLYREEDTLSEKYLSADAYLSGNVRQKLAQAKAAAQKDAASFSVNVEALEKVQPQELGPAEISVQLNSAWLPEDVVNQFMYELLDTPLSVQSKVQATYNRHLGEWKISNRSYDAYSIKAIRTYGTKRAHAYRIIEDILNSRDTRIFDTKRDIDGKEKSVLNAQETAIAQGKQDAIKQAFSSWIWKDQERRHRLCSLYNETFNSIRPREYNGQHIRYHGMNPEIQMRPHQNDAVAHMLYGNNTLLAHVVGAGKTFEMIAGAMESKYLGLCQKSIFVVPNHLTEQWASDFLLLYPNANILVTRKADFQKENRRRFCSKIATGEYDAIIIGQSQFEKIPMSAERQEAMICRQIDDLEQGIESAKRENGEHFSVKAMERSKRALVDRLKRLTEQSRKDDVVTFEQLGVDKMFVDEAHYYKNLFLVTKMRNVAGIAQSEAQKSSDMFMKCQYLAEITNEKGVVFATGTPISNSMVELYTMQRYLQYNRLRELDLERFDEWASVYGEQTTEMELAPEGTGYRFKTRFAKFNNLPELMSNFKEVADIKTADMLNLPVPKANYHNVVVKPSDFQQQYIESLAERAEAIHKRLVEPNEDNMLKVTNEGRKLALDERLIDADSLSMAQSKADICADNVFRIWTETADTRAAQLVFCDLSTPNGSGEFNVYDALKQLLVDRGIPEDEVAYIHNAKSEMQKKNLFAQVRSGTVRVLIGSTQKMGAGTNVQERLIALHHLDCPWRPSDLEQREGRIIRQGNSNAEVEIYRYVTEATFDSYMWQLVEKKQKFIAQIMTSKSPMRSAEDVDETSLSYGEVKALASGNPAIMEKCALDAEVSRLNLQKANFLNDRYEMEDKITQYYPVEIAETKERIAKLSIDAQLAQAHPNPQDGFSPLTVDGAVFTERVPAGERLISICKELADGERRDVGTFRGFQLSLCYVDEKFHLEITNALKYVVTLSADPFGCIRKMENEISGVESMLQSAKELLTDLQQQLSTAQEEVKKEFPLEQLLAEKTEQLGKLNALLMADLESVEVEPNNQVMGVVM